MSELVQNMESVRDLVQALHDFRHGLTTVDQLKAAAAQSDRAKRDQASAVSASSEEPERGYTPAENKLLKLFPINVYSRAMHWLLQQQPVRDFIRYETMTRLFRGLVTFKPDMPDVMTVFLDLLVSVRLQSHLGKAVTGKSPLFHFGRFPLPQPILKIAMEDLEKLSRIRAPGMNDEAEVLKSKCTTAKRIHINGSKYLASASSKEEIAMRLWWERYDFYKKHKV